MATEKTLKTRLKMKHGKASEWALATKFTPLIGEIIVYDADETYTSPRFKVGDGLTNVNNLKFVNQDELAKITTLSDELTTVKNEYVPNTRTVNSKALSSNITLTASDVGAAASSHTHNYLPLTGGTLTGQLTVNSNHIAVKLNSNNSECQIRIQNSDNSENLFLYQNGDARGLYSMNSTGTGLAVLRAPTGTNNWTFNGNSLTATTATELTGVSPKLATSNDGNEVFLLSNTATFAEINSSSGRIAKALDFRHYNTHWRIGNLRGGGTDSVGFGFSYSSDNSTYTLPMYIKTDGSIISKGNIMSYKNSNPSFVLANTSGAYLASMQVNTSDGSYGHTLLTVYKSASESNTFTFDNTGNFRAFGTCYGSQFVSQTNNNPQIALQNSSGANLGMLYMNTAYGSYTNACLRVYASATSYSSFNFGNDGKLSCESLALFTALPISSGGTGSTTAAGARSAIGALATSGGSITGVITSNSWIYSAGFCIRSQAPVYVWQNSSTIDLARFRVNTTVGNFSDMQLDVYKTASTYARYSFGNDGSFRAPSAAFDGGMVEINSNDTQGEVGLGNTNLGECIYLRSSDGGALTVDDNLVYADGNGVVYSSTQPSTTVKGTIWLKPV